MSSSAPASPLTRAATYNVPSRNFNLVISKGSVAEWSHNRSNQLSAIVNAANEGCVGGGGADGAISNAGGDALRRDRWNLPELQPNVRCRTGNAVLTGPNSYGSLNVPYVIHAVGPQYDLYRTEKEMDQGDKLLTSAYTASLEIGKSQNIEAIAFALLSSGTFRGKRSLEEVLKVGIKAICGFGGYPALKEVHLCAFSEKEVLTLMQVATDLGLEEEAVEDETKEKAVEVNTQVEEFDVFNELRSKGLLGDHDKGKDLLGVLDEANAIADTIAFKDLQPPFVVGVLGGWGSGKSFTFNLIKERLKEIQKYDLTNENVKKKFPYVGHIFWAWFDVWTYGKGNLWASLMFRILTDLNDQLDLESTITKEHLMKGLSVIELLEEFTTSGERKYLENMVKDKLVQERLRKWNPKGGNITQALIDATNSNYEKEVEELAEKKKMLQEIIVKKKQQLAWKDVTAEKNTSILPEIKELLKKAYKKYGEKNSDEQGFQTVEAALNSIEEWKTNYGRLKKLSDHLRAGSIMTPLGFTVFLASLILAVVLPLILDKIGAVAAAIAPALSGIFAKYHDAKEKLKSAQDEINKVASEMHLDKEHVQEALEAANKAQASAAAKKAQLHSETVDEEKQQDIVHDFTMLNADINSLEDSIWLRKGDSLNKVVGDRAGSSNYEEHLGVVHQAQADLKHISDAMLSNKESFPRGDPRIVLFIDDLDRCPPKKVVETLEAVQLLVKTKLFVVVLAIDAQYVTLCLENEYKNILHPRRHPSGMDYIEKIIQLPYRVPPISSKYMKSYLQEQMNAKEKKPSRADVSNIPQLGRKVEPPVKVSDGSKSHTSKDDTQSAAPGQPNESTPLLPGYINVVDKATIPGQPNENLTDFINAVDEAPIDKETPEPTKPSIAIPTEELEFTMEELGMLEEACVFSGVSPRSSRRLVNVFKLMKIIWYRQDQTPYEETSYEAKMKKACVLILALCASNSKRLRLGMCEVLAKVEQTRSMPAGCDNLKDFINETLRKRGTGHGEDNVLTMMQDEKFSRILEVVVWENEKQWDTTKKDLRLLRSFSFVGEYNEAVDDIHPTYIDTDDSNSSFISTPLRRT